ncbi:hypothetical protein BFJ66_g18519 [Fusarium oxysporum f. sp. cepae]|nr:hypothetical protein BFJ66_g18519 [Fusarium oxysporum f. sp. cepae]
MGLDPAPSTFAIFIGNVFFWYIFLAADLDSWEVGEGRSSSFSLDGRSVKLLLE